MQTDTEESANATKTYKPLPVIICRLEALVQNTQNSRLCVPCRKGLGILCLTSIVFLQCWENTTME